MTREQEQLLQHARRAQKNAYAPYSRFNVGAALIADDGCVYAGANVENVSYGLTLCAERNAIAAMIANGGKRVEALLIVAERDVPTPPCGACLQCIAEFAKPSAPLYLVNAKGEVVTMTLAAFLPMPFVNEQRNYTEEEKTMKQERNPRDIARYIDHTLLKATATQDEVDALCAEAAKYGFASVCVNPAYVPFARERLRETDVAVCTVIGFPLGANRASVKAFETKTAIADGADEIDMVMNVGAFLQGAHDGIRQEIKDVVNAAEGRIVKVILETCYLSDAQIVRASELAMDAEAHFVKTSTGFGTEGATIEAVALMKKTVGDALEVKASGGIRDFAGANAMLDAGATRLGASASVAIVTGGGGADAY